MTHLIMYETNEEYVSWLDRQDELDNRMDEWTDCIVVDGSAELGLHVNVFV